MLSLKLLKDVFINHAIFKPSGNTGTVWFEVDSRWRHCGEEGDAIDRCLGTLLMLYKTVS